MTSDLLRGIGRAQRVLWVVVAGLLLVPVQTRRVLYQFPSPLEVGGELGSAIGLYVTHPALVLGFLGGYAALLRASGALRPDWTVRWTLGLLAGSAVGALCGAASWAVGSAHSALGASLAGLAAGATLAGWAAAVAEVREGDARTVPRPAVAVGIAVLLAATSIMVLEGVWLVIGWDAERAAPWLSWRLYAIWSVHHLVFCAFVGGFAFDHLLPNARSRAIAATIVSLWVCSGWTNLPIGGLRGPSTAGPVPADGTWEHALTERLDTIDRQCGRGPYVIVSASGGGSRAAVTATLALGELARTTIGRCSVHDRLALASGVSGGALALVHDALDPSDPLRSVAQWDSMFVGELADRLPPEATHGWWMSSARVDAMFGHFDAPVLRGVILPWMSRGAAVAAFWQETFDWDADRDALDPLLLVHATDAVDGRRVVFGLPPLPGDLVLVRRPYATGAPVEEAYPAALPPALAVRASTAIPFGLDAPEIDGRRFVDGAVFDNTGLDGLALVFEGLARSPAPDPALTDARAHLLDRFRAAGVLLVEVDAGLRPAGGGIGKALDELWTPSRALAQAAYPREHLLRELNRMRLCAALGTAEGGLPRAGYVVTPDEPPGDGDERNPVVTTWGLGPGDAARVIAVYAADDFANSLAQSAYALTEAAGHPAEHALCAPFAPGGRPE